jgi:perosamine synthetase
LSDTIQIFKPWYGKAEHEALRAPLESGWLGYGEKAREFEKRFAEYVGVKHAIALHSCTAALHLALLVSEVEGHEVLTTPMTFVASNHAILMAGGQPVFCDIEEDTLNIDPADIERRITPQTRVLLAVHYGGHSCDMDALLDIAERHDLLLVEDAAQACGGSYRGRKLGSLGHIGCFSFESKKNLSTGDGGMLVTDDDAVAERVRRLRWLGISSDTWSRFNNGHKGRAWEYEVEEVGYKYCMNDIAAALGLVQLEKLDRGNQMRRQLVQRYHDAFADVEGIEPLAIKEYGESACYSMVVKLEQRDALCDFLQERNIQSAVHFRPNHLYPVYAAYRSDRLSVAEAVWQRILTLPLYPHMGEANQDRVIEGVKLFVEGQRVDFAAPSTLSVEKPLVRA